MKLCNIIERFSIMMTMMKATMLNTTAFLFLVKKLKMISLCLLVDICVQNMTIDVFMAEIV